MIRHSLPQLQWGPNFGMTMDFAFPFQNVLCYPIPRPGSQIDQAPSGIEEGWYAGTDYICEADAKWLPLSPKVIGYLGTPVQPFTLWNSLLTWGWQGGKVRLIPDRTLPTNYVDGYLVEPIQTGPNPETDSTFTFHFKLRSKDRHYGQAFRGLLFEYVAGQDLDNPVKATRTRASVGYEITPQGYLLSHPVDSLCDGHYPSGGLGGLHTTLLEWAVTNDISNPEDLSNASWTKLNTTITINNARAPDQAVTADLAVETVTNGNHLVSSNAYTIAAGDVITGLAFLRDGGRYRGRLRFVTGADNFGITFNLSTGVFTSSVEGAAAMIAFRGIILAGGWVMLWWRGTLNGSSVTAQMQLVMQDNSGLESYAGDNASGIYFWGAAAVHGAAQMLGSYTPTTSAADVLTFPWSQVATFPQGIWVYIKFVDLGSSYAPTGQFPQIFQITDTGGSWRQLVYGPGTSGGWSLVQNASGGTQNDTANLGVKPTFGDVVELLCLFRADTKVQIIQAINGGAEVTSALSGTVTPGFPAAYGAGLGLTMSPTTSASHGLAVTRVGPIAGAPASIALARAA